LHGCAKLRLYLVEGRKSIIEDPSFQGGNALEPLHRKPRTLFPLPRQHQLLQFLG
jgi:hypothetical protein